MNFDFLNTAFEVIDLRSFSNLWFWIALAVLWSSTSHWVIGVPFDMVNRAGRGDAAAMADVRTLSGVYSRRILYIAGRSGLWITGFNTFVLTSLYVAGFVYGSEFCQAVFLLAVPLTIVALMSLITARKVAAASDEALVRLLRHHRTLVQVVGMASIFVTSMWGMYTNLNASALGY